MDELILDGHKLHWHRERVEAWQRGERIAPITIDMALTRKCNFRCVFCYSVLQENDEKKMTPEVIRRFMADAGRIGVKAISFVSDGESATSPNFLFALEEGKQNGMDMAVGTNGYPLRDAELPRILRTLTYLRFNFSAGERKRYAEIMGCAETAFDTVCRKVRECVRLKREEGLPVTIGLQMVLMPDFADQVLPLARLGKDLGVDYLVIKHCSDDENHALGVEYDRYAALTALLKEAEAMSDGQYQVKVKWSKILSGGLRHYQRCFGPPFMLQISGSGLVAPCGMFFNDKYADHHIGNIVDQSFEEIWRSERYWEVMGRLGSSEFNPGGCGSLCLQHKVNEFLYDFSRGKTALAEAPGPAPAHVNFI